MKLAAIYNVWDGVELLGGSIECIRKDVDLIIIIYQKTSNFGEVFDPSPMLQDIFMPFAWGSDAEIIIEEYIPTVLGGAMNELQKRNRGIRIAQHYGATHFLHMDCDEYYKNFSEAKKMFIDSGAGGSVCKMFTYFRDSTYRFEGPDNYYVPFIHQLKPETIAGNRKYPFYVDPTRGINEENVVELPIFMHHFSYIRENIQRKINNSSAKKNILQSNLLADYYTLSEISDIEGYFVKDFNQKLTVVDNYFDIKVK